MTAFFIGRVEITDHEAYAEYARLSPGTVIAHGGKYQVRGVGAFPRVRGFTTLTEEPRAGKSDGLRLRD